MADARRCPSARPVLGRTRGTGAQGGSCGLALAVRAASRGRDGRSHGKTRLIVNFQAPGASIPHYSHHDVQTSSGTAFCPSAEAAGGVPPNAEVPAISEGTCVYGDKEGARGSGGPVPRSVSPPESGLLSVLTPRFAAPRPDPAVPSEGRPRPLRCAPSFPAAHLVDAHPCVRSRPGRPPAGRSSCTRTRLAGHRAWLQGPC